MTKSETRFQTLVESFPSLTRARGVHPWDAMAFLGWLCSTGLSHGELLAARFVLGVWNSQADWEHEATLAGLPTPAAAKRFDLLEAASVWDRAHLDAVQAWLEAPFWP